MHKVVILSLVFRPDNVSTAQLMGDLATDLKALGHDISVITTTPHFNHDPDALGRQPIGRYWGRLLQKSQYNGIEVLHVWMPRKGNSKIMRIAGWLLFHGVSTFVGLSARLKPDLILTPSPPLTIGVSAWLLGLWHKCPFVYNVQEIYPDVAINLGILKRNFLINILKRIEWFVYEKAASLSIISEAMADNIIHKGVKRDKLQVIPNFVDSDEFEPLHKNNHFSRKHCLQDKFVISYAGNMGLPQGLNILLEAARLLKNTGVYFLLMGSGSERRSLMEMALAKKLNNVMFLDYQPYSLMREAYAAVEGSFVSQTIGTCNDGIPSKVYRIMASERPVIACTEENSDLSQLINKAKGGVVIRPGDANMLASVIEDAWRNPEAWKMMGVNARTYIKKYYSRQTVSRQYDALIRKLVREKRVFKSTRIRL